MNPALSTTHAIGFGQAILVLSCHHSGFRHGRMLYQDALDLGRATHAPLNLEHVVGPAIEPVVTVAVLVELVTGRNPMPLDRCFVFSCGSSKRRKPASFLIHKLPISARRYRLPLVVQGFSLHSPERRVRRNHTVRRQANWKQKLCRASVDPMPSNISNPKRFAESLAERRGPGPHLPRRKAYARQIEAAVLVAVIHQRRVIGGHGKKESGTMPLNYIIDISRRGRSRPKNCGCPNGQGK